MEATKRKERSTAMTDREYLELAAKACGMTLQEALQKLGRPINLYSEWNPIADDGDALRLAATLGINIAWRADGRVAAYRHANANGYCFTATAFESSREDRAANVRRAIVRAAAEIGRSMDEEHFGCRSILSGQITALRERLGEAK